MRLHGRGEFALCSLGSFFQPLQCQLVGSQVDAILLLKLSDNPVEDFLIEVLATQEAVAARGQHLENSVVQFENRDVEGPTAQIVDDNLFVLMLAKSIG